MTETNPFPSTRKTLCDACPFRKFAERSPGSIPGRLWIWHTTWCPGWKRSQKARWEQGLPPPPLGDRRGFWAD